MLILFLVLFLDNVLLLVAQYTSRHPRHSHNRDISWGNRSLVSDSDNEAGGLISKYPSRAPSPGGTPKGTPRSRGHTPAPSLNRVQTAYTPYSDSPPQPRDFVAGPSNGKARMPSRSPGPAFGSDVTLRDEGHYTGSGRVRANTGDFSYENTPTSALPEGQGLGIGITVHRPSTPSLYSNNEKNGNISREPNTSGLKEKASWKSLGVMNEHDYEGKGYGDAGLQQPTRARTVSFGDHGNVA